VPVRRPRLGAAHESDAAFSLSTDLPQGAENESARTGSRTVCDAVGNCSTAGPMDGLRVDRRPPRVACDRPDGGWHAVDVEVTCTADDGGAGLADPSDASFTLSTKVPTGTEDTNAATDIRRVCDAVGHCATAGPVDGLRIDKAPPRIALTGMADGSIFLLNQAVSAVASVKCLDDGSGVASCSVPDSVGTSAVGTFSFTATETDAIGNAATASVSYTVAYGIELRYDTSEPTRKIELRLVDANGENVSSSEVVVTAVDIDGMTPLGRRFVYSKSAEEYFFTVPGKVDSGPHILHFTAGDDPVVHSAPFVTP
jgi:hypothetical protein